MRPGCRNRWTMGCFVLACGASLIGCADRATPGNDEWALRDRIELYRAERSNAGVTTAAATALRSENEADLWDAWLEHACATPAGTAASDRTAFTLGTLFASPETAPASEHATPAEKNASAAPEGYWRQDIWHQMGHEALALGGHDFWRGFKTSYWNVPNFVVLSATLGGSYAIRGTGVDTTIAHKVHHHQRLGQFDDTLQILGNPATHFAATGVLWLTSTLLKDVREHEVAKSLTQALCVNGVSTLVLKAATNTSSPDGDRFGWPSGHTSSAFTVAAVLNEYYGPWVGIPSLGLAGLVGYQRIDSRVHDFSDVVFGAVLGYVIGTSIAKDNKGQLPELFGMQVMPYVDPETGTSGIALQKSF